MPLLSLVFGKLILLKNIVSKISKKKYFLKLFFFLNEGNVTTD